MSDVMINNDVCNNHRWGTKRYNPNTAKKVWHDDNDKCYNDFNYFGITLYKKRTGEPFLVIRKQVWTNDPYEGRYGYVDDLIYTRDYYKAYNGEVYSWDNLIEQYIPEDVRKMYID